MTSSLFSQLKARGEELITEVSNNLMANPAFIEMLKKGIAAKEAVDEQAGVALKKMNVATRKDLRALERRIDALEAKIDALAAKPARAARPVSRTSRPRRKAVSA